MACNEDHLIPPTIGEVLPKQKQQLGADGHGVELAVIGP